MMFNIFSFITPYLSPGYFDTNKILMVVLSTCLFLYLVIWAIKYAMFKVRLKHFEVAMIRFPNYADVRYKIAEIYYNYGEYELAERYYRETLSIYPYNTAAKIKLAMLLIEYRGNVPEAFKLLAEIRFAADVEHRAAVVIDNYLKGKKLYDKFRAAHSPAAAKSN